jgi:enamine deaminase RidA (YjgF/YER057c/UK114 family)
MRTTRRRFAAGAALAAPAAAAPPVVRKKESYWRETPKTKPLYSEVVTFGEFVFISGHGVGTGTVGEQTTTVLNQIEAALKLAGATLANCVKANVYLKNIDDFKAMNAAYLGRFGDRPPVRTTVAVAGIPLDGCLVEIEVMAHR